MRQSLLLALLAAGNIGIAFLYQWYVLVALGPGVETDALFAGMTVPQIVLAVVSGSLAHVLVPLLAGEQDDRLRQDAWGFFVLAGTLFAAIAALLYILAPWWVFYMVLGFSDAGKDLTLALTRIQLVGMVFGALSGVQWAVYHSRQRFVWAELAPLISLGFCIGPLVWALPRYGVEAAAWIGVLRLVIQTALQMPVLGAWVRPDLKSGAVREAWRRIKPLLWGSAYYRTDPLVDRFLLSMSGSGSLSLYYLAQQIYAAGNSILNKAVAAPLVPRLSVFHKAGDAAGFRNAYRRQLVRVGLVSGVSLPLVIFFGQPLLSVLVGHGAVTDANVTTLWQIMLGLVGMFVGGAMGLISSLAFYAQGDTRLPTRIGIITYTIYVPVKVVCFVIGGPMALALSASAFYLTNLLFQYLYLEKSGFVREQANDATQ